MDVIENSRISQPTQPVQVPVESKKKLNSSTIAILLIVILLVGVGGVYAGMQISKNQTPTPLVSQPTVVPTTFVQPTIIPTSDETANWKTYTNTTYQYSLKYPLNYKEDSLLQNLKGNNPLWLQNIFFYSNNSESEGGGQPWISVIVWKKDVNALDDWFNKHSTKESFDSQKIPPELIILYFGVLTKKEINTGNVNGYQFTSQTMGGPVERVIIDHNQSIYEISLWTNNNLSKDPNIKAIYDQILSTFKFTD